VHLETLKFVHMVFGVIGIFAGSRAAVGFTRGKLFKKWTAAYVKCALITCVTGLMFPIASFEPRHWVAVLTVYISIVTVLAWRRCHRSAIWGLMLALSTMLTFCLVVEVAVLHLFGFLHLSQSVPMLLTTEFIVLLSFAWLGVLIVRKYQISNACCK